MELRCLDCDLSVCKVRDIPPALLREDFCFIGKTDEELSLVCRTEQVPADTLAREDGWRGFRIEGMLDFSLIGILAPIADILAKNHVGIFALSTYNTDYILVKREQLETAIAALRAGGYEIR